MIVDLQGVNGLLTDPQLHCMDRDKFGKGNLGYVGMIKFFMTHVCNSYCKDLGLVHPKRFIEINEEYDFFVTKYVPPKENKEMNKICDICKRGYKANVFDLYDKKKKCWDSFCKECDEKGRLALKEGSVGSVVGFISLLLIFI